MNIILNILKYFMGFIILLVIGILIFNFGDSILDWVQNYVEYH